MTARWHLERYDAQALQGYSLNTRRAYRSDVAGFVAWAGANGLASPADVAKPEVRAWLFWLMHQEFSEASITRKVIGCRRYWKWATRVGLAVRNPLASTHRARPSRSLPRIPTPDELGAMIDLPAGAGADPWQLQATALLELLYGSGLRVSEAVGLDVEDLDARRRRVRVMGKGARERFVPISEPTVLAVRRHRRIARPHLLRGHDHEALFIGWHRGRRLGARGVRRIVDERSDFTLYPHHFRHAFATHLLDGGADVRAIQVMLGHQRLDDTAWYAQVSPQHLRKVIDQCHPR